MALLVPAIRTGNADRWLAPPIFVFWGGVSDHLAGADLQPGTDIYRSCTRCLCRRAAGAVLLWRQAAARKVPNIVRS